MNRLLFCFVFVLTIVIQTTGITLDGSQLERVFNGIGGLSGGGATSRLLVDYPPKIRDQILDYLFLPNFGASLHILKVEIGGDCQTTDGTESSHMHNRNDENYNRGYEWWLMKEAKKRNPNIKIYGLSWGVPGWIGDGQFFSDDNVYYHVAWVKGAKEWHNVDVDYIGIWNEKSFTSDKNCTYIKNLRAGLDAAGFHNTKIVVADGDWEIIPYLQNDPALFDAVSIVGVHYPGTVSPQSAINLKKALWASEDYSTFADSVGGGCWARILNQNYVNGYMTATISWDLIASYAEGLPFFGDGLMWAYSPWSGNYEVKSPIWVSAHTTQFTQPGWIYLKHGSGTGKLPQGGSYVTLVPDSVSGDFSLIIETLSHDQSICIRPNLPPYTVQNQTVTFQITGGLLQNSPLHVWYTHLSADENQAVYFVQQADVYPVNGAFTLNLNVDSIWTISTTTGQKKGVHPPPPKPQAFPTDYYDNFDSYEVDSEAKYFADQTGVWEIALGKQSKVMRQVVTTPPIVWCDESSRPISLIGVSSMRDADVSVSALIEGSSGSVGVSVRVPQGGCGNNYNAGYFFNVNTKGEWNLTAGLTVLKSGQVSSFSNKFHQLRLNATSTLISAYLDNVLLASVTDSTYKNGFVGIGSGWNYAQFDNFRLHYVSGCSLTSNVVASSCVADSSQRWKYSGGASGTIVLASNSSLCLTAQGTSSGSPVVVSPCVGNNVYQTWSPSTGEQLLLSTNGLCLDITGQNTAQCAAVEVWSCNGGPNQQWTFKSDGTIQTSLDGFCLTS